MSAFTFYPGWEQDVWLLAEQTDRDYEGTRMATDKGMAHALAAQRIMHAFPPRCPTLVDCGHGKQLCGHQQGHVTPHRSNDDHSVWNTSRSETNDLTVQIMGQVMTLI